MKNYFILIFIFIAGIVIGQTNIPTSNMIGTITSSAPGTGANVYDITIGSVDDQSDVNFDGTNVMADGRWVVWQGCQRYVVTGITNTFPTTIVIEVTADNAGNVQPSIGLVTIVNETEKHGLAKFTSGTPDPDNQCIQAFYLDRLDDSIFNPQGGFNGYVEAALAGVIAGQYWYALSTNNIGVTEGQIIRQ